MKIENNNINPLSTNKTETSQSIEKRNRSVESVATSQGKDKAELSDKARILAKARTALNNTSDINTERVSQLQNLVNEGRYQIPFADLANRLLGRLGLK
jgi:flagellar biosynthesis anti-sigma factor FlgM